MGSRNEQWPHSDSLRTVCGAIDSLFRKSAESLKFVPVNRCVYHLVKDPSSFDIFVQAIKETFDTHAGLLCDEVKQFQTLHNIIKPWEHYDYVTRTPGPAILSYLDDLCKKNGAPVSYQLGLIALADKLFLHPTVSLRLRPILWNMVTSTRANNMPDAYMKQILGLLHAISRTSADYKAFYEDYFENAMIEDACAFYRPLIGLWTGYTTCEYLEAASAKINEELRHTQMYLPESTQRRLKSSLETCFMDSRETDGLRGLLTRQKGGISALLCDIPPGSPDTNKEALSALYKIFHISRCRDNYATVFCELLEKQYKEDAAVVTSNPELKNTIKASYIAPLLQLKRKFELIVHESLGNHKIIKESIDALFPRIIRALPSEESTAALAAHFHLMLRNPATKDSHLQEDICVLQYLDDKDIFENRHRKYMRRRLIMSEPSEDQLELEYALIRLIKNHYDTTTLEFMLQDYRRALTERDTWAAHAANLRDTLPLTFRPIVLNFSRWSEDPLRLIMPPVLQRCVDIYTAWYHTLHHKRKLNWIAYGSAEVSYKLGRTYRLHLDSAPQLIFLLQFDNASTLTVDTIAANTGSTPDFVRRFLAPFASKQIGILTSHGESYTLNPKFKPSKMVIKVPMGARAQASEDKTKSTSEILLQRQGMTQAAIVRIMKSLKALKYADLVARVMEELQKRFRPEPRDIKKEIEHLIQSDYIKRSDSAHDMYEYVA